VANALLVVDMQVGMLQGLPKHDLQGVIGRINRLTDMVRRGGGTVIWIRHCGPAGSGFERDGAGWAFLPELKHRDGDRVVEKTLNDAFAGTDLAATLKEIGADRLLVTGWATDFCVDTTVRSAVSNGYAVVVPSDAHTLADRPHLDAASIIRHHNWVWSGLITNRSIRVAAADELIAEAR
jgi:nicotinamidase-related amidase